MSNFTVTKDMNLGELLEIDERIAGVLAGFGLHCFGCPMSKMETLEQAANTHGVPVELMIEKITELLNE